MSQVNSYDREQYSTNGVAKTFSFGWNVNSKDDIHVKFCRADGTIVDSATFIDSNDDEYTTSTYNYVVELNRQGGTITFPDTPKENQNLIIYRETPLVYENSFKTATAFPAAAIDAAYRKIWLALQEVQSDLAHNTVRLTPNQRGLYFAEFSEAVNNRFVFYDNLMLKYTEFTTTDVANAIQLSASVPQIAGTASEALNKATNALTLAGSVNTTLNAHIADTNNPHRVSLQNLIDTAIDSARQGDFLMFDGIKWKNTFSTAVVYWGDVLGDLSDQADLKNALDAKANVATTYTKTEVDNALSAKVNIDGTSIMTAPLKFGSGSMRGAVGPYLNGVSFWKMDAQHTITNIANLTDSRFLPVTTNSIDLGRSANTWKDLYLGGKAYVATINNGADLSVPAKSGTLATMGDVELAASSGRMLTDQGVWYAKMYSATVPPSAEDGTNYADFSQVDQDDNPIIVIYERQSGAWVLSETITPPAEYDGYVPITSKIWDIAEQAGQQGGRVLWNHISKEFTPYPTIISFEDIEITGDSTVIMPLNPSGNQIVNKDYVDSHIPTVGNGTITINQGGTTKGTFTTNQSGDTTIDLDAGGAGGYHPDLFAWEWSDALRNDVQWLRADTFSWQQGSTYKAAYKHLRNDMYNWYSWENNGTTIYTKKAYPEVGEKAYSDSALTTEVGEITDVTDTLDITVEQITVNNVVYDSVSGSNIAPTTETVGGVTVQYIPAEDGHKIVTDFHESEVADVYTATGEAWYYIIDYGFKRFKLPRAKHNKYATTLSIAGTGKTLGLTSGGGANFGLVSSNHAVMAAATGNFDQNVGGAMSGTYNHPYNGSYGVTTDASKSGIVANQTQNTDQYKYLYFYVGEFTQTAIENTAGLNAELFNDKADTDLQNTPMATADYVVEWQNPTSGNNYTWYRKYRSGWVEQGGISNSSTSGASSITIPVEMSNSNYSTQITPYQLGNYYTYCAPISTTQIQIRVAGSDGLFKNIPVSWQVSGVAA